MQKFNLPKIRFSLLRNIILLSLVISISFSSGYMFGGNNGLKANQYPKVILTRETPTEKGNLDFNLFWRVWDTLEQKYYDKEKIIPSEMVYGAIKGMVSAVGDPYTVYLPPEENKVIQEDLSGEFEGVGIQIGFKGKQLAVIAPLPSSPAEEKGVEAGDLIIAIKDEGKNLELGTEGMTLPEAVKAIRGKAGTIVTLTLLRGGSDEAIVVDIVREAIDVPSVVVEYVGENGTIAHIKLLKFSGDTLKEWEKAIANLVSKRDLEGIIFDVRNNPGGYLDDAIELASEFLENGRVVVKEEGTSGLKKEYKVEKLGRLRSQKMAVLINEGSASASEILAGALQDNKRATIVGQVSFGKGTIQESVQIEGNGGLHVTVARWLTPNGFWVNEGGLKPDVPIEDNKDTDEDEQLQKAIEILTE